MRYTTKAMSNFFEEKWEYLKAIKVILKEMEVNLKKVNRRVGGDSNLEGVYGSVSYLGTIKGIELETQEKLLQYLKNRREDFKEGFKNL